MLPLFALIVLACVNSPTALTAQEQPAPAEPEAPAQPAKPAEPAKPAPIGQVFPVKFERGEGSIHLSRQNGMLRLDVDAVQPYYAGDAQANRGTSCDVILTVDGQGGRRLQYFPSPIWAPNTEPMVFRLQSSFSKTESEKRLVEAPHFGATCNVAHWDRWQATLYIDLRYVVVPGSSPASVAENWRIGVVMGSVVTRAVWPEGINAQQPAAAAEALHAFKLADLPEQPEAETNPRDAAVALEKEMQEAMAACRATIGARDWAGLEKKAKEAAAKYPEALWSQFLVYLVAQFAGQNNVAGLNTDLLEPLKAYVDACPGQSRPHYDYLNLLLRQGKLEAAQKHFATMSASPLMKGLKLSAAMISIDWATSLTEYMHGDEAEAVLKPWREDEWAAGQDLVKSRLEAADKSLKAVREELAFRAEDAKKTNPRLTIETTKGTFVVELYEDDAPNTTASLVDLARKGFYNDLTFHRFEPNFVIQGGCPQGSGMGDPGYRMKSEIGRRQHFYGSFGMARSQEKDTEGSQFYVCLTSNQGVRGLSGNYTIAGRVIEGMQVVDSLRVGDKMTKVTASNLREHEYKPVTIAKKE